MGFIELHQFHTGMTVLVNIEGIKAVEECANCTRILVDHHRFRVRENFCEVRSLLIDALGGDI